MLTSPKITFSGYVYQNGNTPAVDLVQNLPPESDANVLLLACGDPRSILYTAYSTQHAWRKRLDFTCCDMEPAVLARNILLLSLLLDGSTKEHFRNHWNFFYHILLDRETLTLVQSQSRKLVSISETLEMWHGSIYGSVLRIVNKNTLRILRSYWQKYVETANFSPPNAAAFEEAYRQGWEETKKTQDKLCFQSVGGRSAGPLYAKITDVLNKQFKKYWLTGVTCGDAKDAEVAKFANPTFAYSSLRQNFSVYFGNDPLLGFHLETAHSELISYETSTSKSMDSDEIMSAIVRAAKSQFRAWSVAFSRLARGKFTIRFFLGDILQFCPALKNLHTPATEKLFPDVDRYNQHWSVTPLQLDGPDYERKAKNSAPRQFDVIDTSNVIDMVGLLNVMVTTVPLLSPKSTSIIYTDTVNAALTPESLSIRLLCDFPTMSLLLGVAPVPYLTGKNPHFDSRTAWKIPILGDHAAMESRKKSRRVKFCPVELASVLHQIYLRIAVFELYNESNASFAALLRIAQTNVDVEWDEAIAMLIQHIIGATEPGKLDDLFVKLHLFGIHSVPELNGNPRRFIRRAELQRYSTYFASLDMLDPPSVVCITLAVPKANIDTLKRHIAELCTGCLLLGKVSGFGATKLFYSVHATFGTLIPSSDSGRYKIEIDDKGWKGAADLVVSFWVPSYILFKFPPSDTQVSLGFAFPPGFKLPPALQKEYGPDLTLFKTTIAEKNRLLILPERPGTHKKPTPLSKLSLQSSGSVEREGGICIATQLALTEDGLTVDGFKVFVRYPNVSHKRKFAVLSSGVKPAVTQDSPCTLVIKTGIVGSEQVTFPFPIDGSRCKLTPLPFMLEVVVPLSKPGGDGGYALSPFPVLHQGGVPINWDMPQVSLDHLPVIDTTKPGNTAEWLNVHMSYMFSEKEVDMLQRGKAQDVQKTLRRSIHSMILTASGNGHGVTKCNVFAIHSDKHGGMQALIFVENVRFDLCSRTVVADTSVMPLTHAILPRFQDFFSSYLKENNNIIRIDVSDEELASWKQIIPAAVERCRNWSHGPRCEYRKIGIPISRDLSFRVSPLCSCAKGKVSDEFEVKQKAWKSFAKFSTRAALGGYFPALVAGEKSLGLLHMSNQMGTIGEFTIRDRLSRLLVRIAGPLCRWMLRRAKNLGK